MFCLDKTLNQNTIVDLLRYRAKEQPYQLGYTFLLDGEKETKSYSYQQLDEQAKAIAAMLQQQFHPGDRALLLYPPGLEYITAFFGCLYAGIVAIPAYPPRPNRSLQRLENILKDAEAKIALTTEEVLGSLEKRLDQATLLKNLYWVATDKVNDHQQYQHLEIDSQRVAFLQYTSGSTSTPKGVMISHENLLHNSSLIYQAFGHHRHSQGVIWLPPYHDMGLIGGIIQPLYAGFNVILMSPLMFLQNPLRWLQAISRYGGTSSGGPNFAYELCLRKINQQQIKNLDLSSWEVAFNGAEPINYQTLEKFATTFAPYGFRQEAFYPCYGMAEATLIISGGKKNAKVVSKTVQGKALAQNQVKQANLEDENSRTLISCGQSFLAQQIIIVNPETLTKCDADEVGEIWVAGPSIAQSYWNHPLESKETFKAHLADTQEGPFLRTGDLGFMDEGELFVTGRLKDVIIINGRNYYPQDIEWTIAENHPQIRPNCLAAFSIEIAGEEKLVIVAEIERLANFKDEWLKPKELIQSIRKVVSGDYDLQVYKTLLIKPGTIPKTSSGKVQRHLCRAKFIESSLELIVDI